MLKTAALAASLAAAATVALAQTPPAPTVVRGKVAAMTPASLTVKPDKGPAQVVNLTPSWSVAVMKPVAIDAIQPGSFIGTSEMPKKDGTGKSLEVHVFPPGVKMGEGHYGWDLKKGSMMTNGTVGKVVTGDAMFCQKDVCQAVHDGDGDYLFAVKDNQPTLHFDIACMFAESVNFPPYQQTALCATSYL